MHRSRQFQLARLICGGALLLALLAAGCRLHGSEDAAPGERPPNVVVLFTDDQGYADVGVYGAEGFETPHLDRMAREGLRFTQFYMAASACTPSRAALLTGSYPMRVGLPHVLGPRSLVGINPAEVTLAELLKGRGYATAAVGKWHLGDHPVFLPTNHGFDHYFGIPYSNDMSPDPRNNPRERARRHPPLPLVRDTTVVEREPDQSTLTRRYTEEAVRFIEANRARPFFLYLAHSFPHVPLYASDRFRGTTRQGRYGDVIREIDWSVGEILGTLDRLGLDRQTLVVFTSDNGPWLVFGDHAGSAGPLREGKGTSFEGGHRVPLIVRWPGRIPAGRVSSTMITAMDLLPTIAGLAGAPVPAGRVIDGHDIRPVLAGAPGAASPYEAFYYYRGDELQAVRSGRWKLHVPHTYRTLEGGSVGQGGMPGTYGQGTIGLALFDLEADPGETTDVAGRHPEVVRRLADLVAQGRRELGDGLSGTAGRGVRAPGRLARPWQQQADGSW